MSTDTSLEKVHELLVEADAILKAVYFSDVPGDTERAVAMCALQGASRILHNAMALTGK